MISQPLDWFAWPLKTFRTLNTESAWGTVWASPKISKRERSIITIALLAALGHWEEVAMRFRATKCIG
jgi:4-carboxymuconolactone decarboxylase